MFLAWWINDDLFFQPVTTESVLEKENPPP